MVVLVTGFLATIVFGGFRLRELDASTGASDPHDFTVRISPFVLRADASTAPCPSFATMAYAPLVGQDGGSDRVDLPDGSIEIFLRAALDSFSGMPADLPVGLICRTAQADFVIAGGATRPPKHDAYRFAPPVYR